MQKSISNLRDKRKNFGFGDFFNVVNKNNVTIIKIKMKQVEKVYLKSKICLDFWGKREQIQGWTFVNPLK